MAIPRGLLSPMESPLVSQLREMVGRMGGMEEQKGMAIFAIIWRKRFVEEGKTQKNRSEAKRVVEQRNGGKSSLGQEALFEEVRMNGRKDR